jgi:hypothetical protein
MSTLIYALCSRLFQILDGVGVGTNRGLHQVFFALLSGRCLQNRGALFPALTDSGAATRGGAPQCRRSRVWKVEDHRSHRRLAKMRAQRKPLPSPLLRRLLSGRL